MDYSLAAVKLFSEQLKEAREMQSRKGRMSLGGILFQRVWLQGLLVFVSPDADSLLLDDGTGLVLLSLSTDFRQHSWALGMYVMVVGANLSCTDDIPLLKVHKIVDLSTSPHRETMWYLEVMEAYKLFYEPLIKGFV